GEGADRQDVDRAGEAVVVIRRDDARRVDGDAAEIAELHAVLIDLADREGRADLAEAARSAVSSEVETDGLRRRTARDGRIPGDRQRIGGVESGAGAVQRAVGIELDDVVAGGDGRGGGAGAGEGR